MRWTKAIEFGSPTYLLWLGLIGLFVILGLAVSWVFYIATGIVWAIVAIPKFYYIFISKGKEGLK